MYRSSNIKTHCTDTTFLQLMGLLEVELSARAQEDDEERRHKGHASLSSASVTLLAGKAPGKKQNSARRVKEVRGKEARHLVRVSKDTRPVCTDYLSDNGCPRGDQCTYHRSLGNGVRKNGVRNRCPYRRCGVDTEIPYRLLFWREFCLLLPVRMAKTGSILNFRIGSVSSIGGLIAATLFADTVSDS